MKQRINIYISKLALDELDRLAQAEGKSRGGVMEGLVLGARDVDARLKALEAGQIIRDLGRADPDNLVPGDPGPQASEDPVVEGFEEAP